MFPIPRLSFVLLLLAGLAVTAPGARARESGALPRVAELVAAAAPMRVVAFGSSSTEGVGASTPAAAYPSVLERELDGLLPAVKVVVLNRGIGGEDSDDMMRRLPAILAERPDLVIWQTGSNDPLRDVPLERFDGQTRAGIAAIRAAGSDVMLMEPQLCRRLAARPGADRFRDAVRSIGAEMGVPVIRRFELMQSWLDRGLLTPAQMLSADGLHMADAGYALLAGDVAREIVALARNRGRIGTALR